MMADLARLALLFYTNDFKTNVISQLGRLLVYETKSKY